MTFEKATITRILTKQHNIESIEQSRNVKGSSEEVLALDIPCPDALHVSCQFTLITSQPGTLLRTYPTLV